MNFSPESLLSIMANDKLREKLLNKHDDIFDNHHVEDINRIEGFLNLRDVKENNTAHAASIWGSFHSSLNAENDRSEEMLEIFGEHKKLDGIIQAKDDGDDEVSESISAAQNIPESDKKLIRLDSEEYLNLLADPPALQEVLDARKKEIEQMENDFRVRMRSYILGQITNMQGMLQVLEEGSSLQKGTQVYIDWLHSVLNNSYSE